MQDAVAIAAKALASQPEQQAVPFWKPILLVAMMVAAGSVTLMVGMPWGLLVLGATILFYMLGGFDTARRLHTATRFRVFSFGIAWFCVTIMSVGTQFVFPAFEELFLAMGQANVPLPTHLVMKWHPVLTLLPKLVGSVWMFWPSKATSLRAAIVASCLSIGLIVLAVAALYLPLWQARAIV